MPNTATLSLARQPIFDHNVKVCGYELLYRSGQAENGTTDNQSTEADTDSTPPVLTLTTELSDIGLDSIVADVPVWIDELPIDDELEDAIIMRDGAVGDLIARVVAHEQDAAASPLDARTTTGAYVEAIDWAMCATDMAVAA